VTPTQYQIWCKSVYQGLVGKWVKCNNNFYLYPFPENSFTNLTDQQIFTLKQRGLTQALWSSVDIAPNLGSTRNALQSLAYSPLGAVVSPPSEYL